MENNIENMEFEENGGKGIKNKKLIIAILILVILAIGGTFAWLILNADITNANYSSGIHCFDIDYTISNGDQGNTQDMTGTLFPTDAITGGISGRVGMKVSTTCDMLGVGELKLHVDSNISNTLLTPASSYCEDRSTLEAVQGYNTKAACETAEHRWQGYGDNYCENPDTLERMPDYTNENDCEGADGTWTVGGSPLKYAVYDTDDTTQTPVAVGHITTSDKGTDKTIYDNFSVTKTQAYYYVYIWLDGYLTDNNAANIPFAGYVTASATQGNAVSNGS